MIDDNASSIFNEKAIGVKANNMSPNTEYDEYNNRVMNDIGEVRSLNPINFDEKIMGGERTSMFLSGKMSSLPGMHEYSMRVNKITGKGGNMNDNIMDKINVSSSSDDKINQMLGYKNNKKKSTDNINKTDIIGNILGNDKINSMMGINKRKPDKKSDNKFDMSMGFGRRAFSGFNMQNKVNNYMQFQNPEKIARKRMRQQNKLDMFGDYDGDKVINMFDCDPLDPNKQGERHSPDKVMGIPVLETYGAKSPVQTYGNTQPKVEQPKVEQPMDNPSKVDKPMTKSSKMEPGKVMPDVMTAPRPNEGMGNFDYSFNVDVDKDGDVDEQDINSFNSMNYNAQLNFAQEGIRRSTGKERKSYNDLLIRLMKTAPNPLDVKKAELAQRKFEAGQLKEKTGEQLALRRLGLEEQRAAAIEKREELKAQRQFALEKAKLRQAQTKGELALWESKIKAGTNILGSLIGGTDKPRDAREIVGTVGSDAYNIARMTAQQPLTYESKVYSAVGMPGQKSFAQVVQESVSDKTVQDVIQQSQTVQPQVVQPQVVQPQVVQPQAVQPQMVPSQGVPSQMLPSQIVPPQESIPWGQVQPQQVAQIDPQYAKYLEESKGETTYRRGPYKKRRY